MEIAGRRVVVEVQGDRVQVDGQEVTARLLDGGGTPVRVLMLDDVVHRFTALRGEPRGRYSLSIDGYRVPAEVLDERMRAARDLAARRAPTGPAPLVAPMPGLVVRVSVAPGDHVTTGQGLVVVEAMKMENELRAAAAGRVRAVHARPGAAVEKGTLLIELE